MPLVSKALGPYGLESWRISTLSQLDGSDGAFQIQADLIFTDAESARRAFKEGGTWLRIVYELTAEAF